MTRDSPLSRVGVQFSQAQRDVIKLLVESGHLLEAQDIILRELETEFGGSDESADKKAVKAAADRFFNE